MFSKTTLLLLLTTTNLGCGGSAKQGDSGSSDAAADTDDGGGDTDEAPCTVLTSGDWLLNGTSIGHEMFGTLAFDEDACTFTLSDWNMNMDIATGGTIAGDQLTFVGFVDDPSARDWAQCSGTVESATSATAQCDDGATITMDFDG
jgi:hypothetical protein